MCCRYNGLISAIATWAFFSVLLALLNVANPMINGLWLTVLLFIAIWFCPVLNPSITNRCVKPKKKK